MINPDFRVELQPSRSVEGVVTVPDGFNPAEVTVRIQVLHVGLKYNSFPRHLPFAGLETALPEIFDKRPDAAGRIRFDDVPVSGSLHLVTVGPGLAEAQWLNENKVFDKAIRLAIAKEGVLTGHVLSPEGKPAPGIEVTARLSFVPGKTVYLSTFRTQTDGNGDFTLRGLPDTPFVLSLEDPSHRATVRPRERLSVAAGQTEDVTIRMQTGVAVTGRVFGPEGKPVEAAAISALADTQEGPGLADDMTDRDGRYRLRLPPGRARLYFNALPDGFVYPNPQVIKRLEIAEDQAAVEDLDFTIYRNADEAQQAAKKQTPEPPAARPLKPDPEVAGRIGKIAEQHAQREAQFRAELQAANDDDQKVREANERYSADKRERADDLMYLITEHAADPAAFDGVLLFVEKMGGYFLDEVLTEIVLDHHLADAQMGRLCFALRPSGSDGWAARILKGRRRKASRPRGARTGDLRLGRLLSCRRDAVETRGA